MPELLLERPPSRRRRVIVTVTCDRCGEHVEGVSNDFGTSGFYYIGSAYWSLYGRPREVNVCNACMWADPGFRHDFMLMPIAPADVRDRLLRIDREHPVRGSRSAPSAESQSTRA